jgi:hypothetical protein
MSGADSNTSTGFLDLADTSGGEVGAGLDKVGTLGGELGGGGPTLGVLGVVGSR